MGIWARRITAATIAAAVPYVAVAATNWSPNLEPRVSPSENAAQLPSNVTIPVSPSDLPPRLSAFIGRWEGWLCNNASTDAKVAITVVSEQGAQIVYASANGSRKSQSWRATPSWTDGELVGDFSPTSRLTLAMRKDGHLNIRTQDKTNEKNFCTGVLTNMDKANGPKLYAALPPEVIRIPAGADYAGNPVAMYTTLVRPKTEDRKPLVVINHGAPAPTDPYWASNAAQWFAGRGYVVVLPIRRGYPPTGGGGRADAGGGCAGDYYYAGLAAANDILTTIDYMQKQPYVTAQDAIVVGQSAGGWAVMAASTRALPGVAGIVNFAGGWRVDKGACAENRLISTARQFGTESKIPMLWVYSENDTYFGPNLARNMFAAYTGAGGKADLTMMPPFSTDGHGLFVN
ncbi:MAG: prolyl oligopeptidase family serine peptidase, partial [Rhodospirillales bacterium]|nr:prolyl oligopeptidase family serine peptidase [Rhodospirillales bacterium]